MSSQPLPRKPLTAAQAAQQDNRDPEGKYAHKAHGAPGAAAHLSPVPAGDSLVIAFDDADDIEDFDALNDPYADEDGEFEESLDLDFEDARFDAANEIPLAARLTAEETERIFAMATIYARQANRKYGASRRGILTEEDIAQETVFRFLERINKGAPMQRPSNYMNRIACRVAAQAASNARYDDMRAFKVWQARCSQMEHALGRPLTQAERDAVEKDIYDNWPPERHNKPSPNFVHTATLEVTMKSLSPTDEHDETTGIDVVDDGPTPDVYVTEGAPDNAFEPGSYGDRALRAARGEGEKDRRERLTLAYAALAETRGTPMVSVHAMSNRQATKVRKTVETYPGGITAILNKWDLGETDEGTEAFFAPWAEANDGQPVDEGQRDEIARLFRDVESHQDALWSSAVRMAERPRAARQR